MKIPATAKDKQKRSNRKTSNKSTKKLTFPKIHKGFDFHDKQLPKSTLIDVAQFQMSSACTRPNDRLIKFPSRERRFPHQPPGER